MKISKWMKTIKERNKVLYYLGIALTVQFVLLFFFFLACQFSLTEICHWLKPAKFSLSFAVYVFSLAWYMEYLKGCWSKKKIKCFSWILVFLIALDTTILYLNSAFALDYLSFSEEAEQLFLRGLYFIGTGTIMTTTAFTIYIAVQFFRPIRLQPVSYLWAIRAGFVVFLVSATLGSYLLIHYGEMPVDTNQFGIPLTQFSSVRDLVITMHFLGIHYLQILPICCYFFQKHLGKRFVLSAAGFYLVTTLLIVAIPHTG